MSGPIPDESLMYKQGKESAFTESVTDIHVSRVFDLRLLFVPR